MKSYSDRDDEDEEDGHARVIYIAALGTLKVDKV